MEKKEDKIIHDLVKACESLMGEVCQTKATDWGLVNDAMVAGEGYLKKKSGYSNIIRNR